MSSSYAIISDVHANSEALTAVLDAINTEKVDQILFLGDSVGYGPDPNACVCMLKEKSRFMLAGNHDWAAVGMADKWRFNHFARTAIEWTADVLTPDNEEFLKDLPLTEELADDSIFLVHGTPREPAEWHYMSGEGAGKINLNYFDERMCLVGHSHIPFILEFNERGKVEFHDHYANINKQNRYIINVGSVGQPRDGNPDAAYALLSGEKIEIKRVPYDIVLTQKKMKKAGLPEYLADRLSIGR
jgi:predicted phosphodiesterase